MPIELNHTIIHARDRRASAVFLATVLGLEVGPPLGRFLPVTTDNGVTLDFAETGPDIAAQHYAFLVAEEDFDGIFERMRDTGTPYWADPRQERPGEINHNDGGRGVYFLDPSGHYMEVLTRPYGSGS
ncbi:VOC family protein [Streptomyces stramineus]|uniref:VOC family protein n=1 Tax=Streptomyces stramineus TaxID=173861 RepID=A0ABN1AWI8_9ACTN